MRNIKATLIGSLMALVLFQSCGGEAEDTSKEYQLLGAGATFVAPLLTAWADAYRDVTKGKITVNYQSIGSGGGVRQFLEKTIMFGASEAYLKDDQMEKVKTETGGIAFNIPLTLGDVVPTYNLPGIGQGLVFSAETLSGAFLGEIKRWNDPKIAALNPGVQLPDLPINIVHRSDGSGTTNIWTHYLSSANATWKEKVGFGTSVNWPTGVGGNGNEGVAGVVMNTPGALGYNSLVYAKLNNIAYGKVINKSGNTIDPSLQATSQAAAVAIPEDGRIMVTNTSAPNGYPVAGFVWGLVYENMEKNTAIPTKDAAEQVVKFLYWVVTDGQDLNESLNFARLPKEAQERAVTMISSLKWEGENIGQKVIERVKERGF